MQASTGTRTVNTAEGLWARHAPDLLRLATVLVGPNEAEDVVADAFVRACRPIVEGRVAAPRAYLFRAVTNRAMDQHRRRARDRTRDLLLVPLSCEDSDPRVDVRAAVAGLSVRQRAAVYFRYWHDMSECQIAESMGVSVGTVRRHLVRAQSILRKELANEGN